MGKKTRLINGNISLFTKLNRCWNMHNLIIEVFQGDYSNIYIQFIAVQVFVCICTIDLLVLLTWLLASAQPVSSVWSQDTLLIGLIYCNR